MRQRLLRVTEVKNGLSHSALLRGRASSSTRFGLIRNESNSQVSRYYCLPFPEKETGARWSSDLLREAPEARGLCLPFLRTEGRGPDMPPPGISSLLRKYTLHKLAGQRGLRTRTASGPVNYAQGAGRER
jgi:hypothetical protein